MWPVESLVLEATIHRISWSRPVGLKHSTWLCSLSGPAACAARVADFFGWRVPSISRLWFIAEKFLLHRNWSKTFHLTVLGTFNSVLEDRIWPLMEFIPIQVHTVVHTVHTWSCESCHSRVCFPHSPGVSFRVAGTYGPCRASGDYLLPRRIH